METPEVDGPSHLPPFLVGLSCWAQKETGGGLEAYLAVSRQNCRLLLIRRADEQTDRERDRRTDSSSHALKYAKLGTHKN